MNAARHNNRLQRTHPIPFTRPIFSRFTSKAILPIEVVGTTTTLANSICTAT